MSNLAPLACLGVFLIAVAFLAISALCVYAIYWLLGYYFDWPWFIRIIIALIVYSMVTGVIAGSAKR